MLLETETLEELVSFRHRSCGDYVVTTRTGGGDRSFYCKVEPESVVGGVVHPAHIETPVGKLAVPWHQTIDRWHRVVIYLRGDYEKPEWFFSNPGNNPVELMDLVGNYAVGVSPHVTEIHTTKTVAWKDRGWQAAGRHDFSGTEGTAQVRTIVGAWALGSFVFPDVMGSDLEAAKENIYRQIRPVIEAINGIVILRQALPGYIYAPEKCLATCDVCGTEGLIGSWEYYHERWYCDGPSCQKKGKNRKFLDSLAKYCLSRDNKIGNCYRGRKGDIWTYSVFKCPEGYVIDGPRAPIAFSETWEGVAKAANAAVPGCYVVARHLPT